MESDTKFALTVAFLGLVICTTIGSCSVVQSNNCRAIAEQRIEAGYEEVAEPVADTPIKLWKKAKADD